MLTPDALYHHLRYALLNARVRPWPMPHIYVPDVLPWPLFEDLARTFPVQAMIPLVETGRVSKAYSPKRKLLDNGAVVVGPWPMFIEEMRSPRVANLFLDVFKRQAQERFSAPQPHQLRSEVLVVHDEPGYELGPHSDSAQKVLSAILYMDGWEGTSIYVPKNRSKDYKSGFHYPFAEFDKVWEATPTQNALFAFWKTDDSFHGVEPTTEPRNIVIYDVKASV